METPAQSAEFAEPGAIPAAWPGRTHLELHDELHARPAMAVRSPGVVSYWAQHGMDAGKALEALSDLCRQLGQTEPNPGAGHHVLSCADFDLKFERHGEFISWQVSAALAAPAHWQDAPGLARALLQSRATEALPLSFARAIGDTPMLAAAHVVILKAADEHWLPACRATLEASRSRIETLRDQGDAAALLASRVSDGHAAVMTDLQLGADGFTRFVLVDHSLPADRLARDVQRLCEIEAYRMLAMLGFPVARTEAVSLNQLEAQLQQIVDDMAGARTIDDAAAFDSLLKLSAEIEHGAARTRYRLSATRAYQRIVLQRLSDLREEQLMGLQKLSGFFNRRFAPAMALCESTDARITDIAERINRAVDLARVRVEARREANNQELLASLAHRQQLQLRLQQTVEGLSVVAISYYTLSIVAYLAKAANGLPLPAGMRVNEDVVTALAVVPVVALVYVMVRRLRRGLER